MKVLNEDLLEKHIDNIDFDVTQTNFNKHYEENYQKLNFANISPKKQKNKLYKMNEMGGD